MFLEDKLYTVHHTSSHGYRRFTFQKKKKEMKVGEPKMKQFGPMKKRKEFYDKKLQDLMKG